MDEYGNTDLQRFLASMSGIDGFVYLFRCLFPKKYLIDKLIPMTNNRIKIIQNWMLEDTKCLFLMGLNQDELIRQLKIQELEYGINCICSQKAKPSSYESNINGMSDRILELGGTNRLNI